MTIERNALIEAAANLLADGDLPGPDEDEYTRGLCELISDAAGTGLDKYGVWGEIQRKVRLLSLPTAPGLYQASDRRSVEHAVTYRLTDSLGWVNAFGNESVDLGELAEVNRQNPLVRLIRSAA